MFFIVNHSSLCGIMVNDVDSWRWNDPPGGNHQVIFWEPKSVGNPRGFFGDAASFFGGQM